MQSRERAVTDHSGLCRRLRALKILDEVGSDNPLSREDAAAIEELQARAEKAEAQRDALAKALTSLSNEVMGSFPLVEYALRREMGNTNYNILLQRAEEARAALDAIKGET